MQEILEADRILGPSPVGILQIQIDLAAEDFALPFTKILQDTQMIASSSTNLLLSLIDGKTPAEPSVLVRSRFREG